MCDAKWESIETAPKDGTPVILAWQAVDAFGAPPKWFQAIGWWTPEFEIDYSTDDEVYVGAWTDGAVASWVYEETRSIAATHWMPLTRPSP